MIVREIDAQIAELLRVRSECSTRIVEARADQIRIDQELSNLFTERAIWFSKSKAELHYAGNRTS